VIPSDPVKRGWGLGIREGKGREGGEEREEVVMDPSKFGLKLTPMNALVTPMKFGHSIW